METHFNDELILEEFLIVARSNIGDASHFLQLLELDLRRPMLRLLEVLGEFLPEALGAILKLLGDHLQVQHDKHGKQDLLQVAAVFILFPVNHLKQKFEGLGVVLLLRTVEDKAACAASVLVVAWADQLAFSVHLGAEEVCCVPLDVVLPLD